MTTINEWRGDAPSRAHIVSATIHQAIPGALYGLRIGQREFLERGLDNDTPESIAARLARTLSAGTTTWATTRSGNALTLTGRTAGQPLGNVFTTNPPASYVERIQAGRFPDPQRFTVSLPITTTGGDWSLSLDFGDGAETASGLSATITPAALAAALNALTTPTAAGGGITVELTGTSPRTYRITLGGGLAGFPATVTASGDGLTGNARAEVRTVQSTAASAQEVQAVWLAGVSGLNAGIYTDLRFSADGGTTWSAWSTQEISAWSSSSSVVPHLRSLIAGVYGVTPEIWIRGGDGAGAGGNFGIIIKFPGATAHTPIECQARVSGGSLPTVVTERLQEGGGSSANEFQLVYATESYSLTFDGQTTSEIGLDEGNALITGRLEALSSIGSGEVIVHRGATSPSFISATYVVEFTAGLGSANQPALTSDTAEITTIDDGQPLVNEQQSITLYAAGGTFTITDPDEAATTGSLAFGATAATVQTALQLLASGDYLVSGAGTVADPYLIEFIDDKAATDVSLLTVAINSLTGGADPEVSTISDAVPGVNEIQRVRIDPLATGGSIAAGLEGVWSAPIAYDDDAAEWEAALEGTASIGSGNVAVDGSPSSYVVEFLGDLAWQPLDLLALDQDSLVVSESTAMTVAEVQRASGPAWWNTAENWTLGHVPTSGETVVLGSGRSAILYGLTQCSRCAFADNAVRLIGGGDLVDGQAVRLRTTGTLPSAELDGGSLTLDSATNYYVISVGYVGNDQYVQISTTADGNPIEFTDAGSGTHRIGVRLAGVQQYARFTGPVGWPRREPSGQFVDLARYLSIDLEDPTGGVPNLEIGLGDGDGTPRFHIDCGPATIDARILRSGSGAAGPAVQILNDSVDTSEILLVSGELGLGIEPTELAGIKKLTAFGGRAVVGRADIARIEDYARAVEFMTAQGAGDLTELRSR